MKFRLPDGRIGRIGRYETATREGTSYTYHGISHTSSVGVEVRTVEKTSTERYYVSSYATTSAQTYEALDGDYTITVSKPSGTFPHNVYSTRVANYTVNETVGTFPDTGTCLGVYTAYPNEQVTINNFNL